jgi:hypothetical protein
MQSLQITTEQAVAAIVAIFDNHYFYMREIKNDASPQLVKRSIEFTLDERLAKSSDEVLRAARVMYLHHEVVRNLVLSHALTAISMKKLGTDAETLAYKAACNEIVGSYHREVSVDAVRTLQTTARAACHSMLQFYIQNGVIREIGAIEWSLDMQISEYDFVITTNMPPRLVVAALAGWRDAYLPEFVEEIEIQTV